MEKVERTERRHEESGAKMKWNKITMTKSHDSVATCTVRQRWRQSKQQACERPGDWPHSGISHKTSYTVCVYSPRASHFQHVDTEYVRTPWSYIMRESQATKTAMRIFIIKMEYVAWGGRSALVLFMFVVRAKERSKSNTAQYNHNNAETKINISFANESREINEFFILFFANQRYLIRSSRPRSHRTLFVALTCCAEVIISRERVCCIKYIKSRFCQQWNYLLEMDVYLCKSQKHISCIMTTTMLRHEEAARQMRWV